MADSAGDKTEAPTSRRRQEARDQGQIARSQDLTAAALLLGILMLLKTFGPGVVESMHATMLQMLSGTDDAVRAKSPTEVMLTVFGRNAISLVPVLFGAMLIAIFSNIAQVGFILSSKRIKPDLSLLSPMKGLKKLFSKGNGWVTMLMNILKMVMIAFVGYSAVNGRIGEIVGSQELEHTQVWALGVQIVYDITLRIAILLLVLAVLDYAYQKHKIESSLKMSKQEVKDEMKKMEGDPHIKQRRRQLQMQRAMQRLKVDVPKADVIIVNPTHFSVALHYDSATMTSPKVIAKGQDFLALRIREIAIASGVPILERPPLARALYRTVEVGHEVPEEFYSAIAEILAYVYELSGKLKKAS